MEETHIEMDEREKDKILKEDADTPIVIGDIKDPRCCEKYCCGSISNMPLGYPQGSVRSVLTILIVIIANLALAFGIVWGIIQNNNILITAMSTVLSGELGTVIGYYYGTRTSNPYGRNSPVNPL